MDSFAEDIFRALEELNSPERLTVLPEDRRFELTRDEITLPTALELPAPGGRRKNIYIDASRQYGIRVSPSDTIAGMNQKMRTVLTNAGYIQDPENENRYLRDRPLVLVRESSRSVNVVPVSNLPAEIPMSIFKTVDTMNEFIQTHGLFGSVNTRKGREILYQDLNQYLIKRGYIYDPNRQALVRSSGQGSGPRLLNSDSLDSLITPEIIIQQATAPGKVLISQQVILTLAMTEQQLIRAMGTLQIPQDTLLFVLSIFKLDQLTPGVIGQIHRGIGAQPNDHLPVQLNDIRGMFQRRIGTEPRGYAERTVYPTGPVPDDLQRALVEGYDISTNLKLMNDLATYVGLTPNSRFVRFWALILRRYPEMAILFFSLINQPRNSVILPTIKLFYGRQETNRVEELYTLMVGFYLNLPEDPEMAARRAELSSLPNTYLSLLRQIYRTRRVEEIMDLQPSPLEPYIFQIRRARTDQIQNIVRPVGMTIPPNVDIRQYVIQNLGRYARVLERPTPIPDINQFVQNPPGTITQFNSATEIYTDDELINGSGYSGTYQSRGELIANIFTFLTETGFFLLQQVEPSRATNTRTTLLEEFDEITPPYIGYGRAYRYRVYGIDELNAAFSTNQQDPDLIEFPHPENTRINFSSEELSSFQDLLPEIARRNPTVLDITRSLETKIDRGLVLRASQDRNTVNARRQLRASSDEVKQKVRQIFNNIFYAGMYMRRWKGPGNPYPITEAETLGSSDPQPQSILTLAHVSELMDELTLLDGGLDIRDLILTLRNVAIRARGQFNYTNQVMFDMIGTIAQGKYCIRMGSLPLVLTSYYYILTFFGETIPNLDPTRLVPVQ